MRGSGVALNLPFNRGDFFNRITSESQRFVRQFRRVGKSGGRKRILDRENDLFRNVDVRWSGACHREKVENRAFVRRDRCLGINSSNQTWNALFFRSCCYVFLFFFFRSDGLSASLLNRLCLTNVDARLWMIIRVLDYVHVRNVSCHSRYMYVRLFRE